MTGASGYASFEIDNQGQVHYQVFTSDLRDVIVTKLNTLSQFSWVGGYISCSSCLVPNALIRDFNDLRHCLKRVWDEAETVLWARQVLRIYLPRNSALFFEGIVKQVKLANARGNPFMRGRRTRDARGKEKKQLYLLLAITKNTDESQSHCHQCLQFYSSIRYELQHCVYIYIVYLFTRNMCCKYNVF